ncbi:MAG: rod-binding protein [Pseudomonadota bacterium]
MKIQLQMESSRSPKPVTGTARPSEAAKLKQACADFEAILLDAMFQSMRKTLSGDDLFGKSLGRDLYESMYYTQISKELSNGNGIGLGAVLYRQLSSRIQPETDHEVLSGSVQPGPVGKDPFQKNGQHADKH